MAEITLDSLKETLDVLIDANPHARNKGDEFKSWSKENFDCDARISYIKEQRQQILSGASMDDEEPGASEDDDSSMGRKDN